MINILAVGDVVGQQGCDFLDGNLRAVKKFYNINLTIVNGENSAPGNGITQASAGRIFSAGADVITTGNHVFARREAYEYLDSNEYVIRPANYHKDCPGRGTCLYDMGHTTILIANLSGTVFMDSLDNPFLTADKIIKDYEDCKVKIFDFHAETTSEKQAMAHYLDGRASVLFGTHTHVQTNDDVIYPKGLGYISDVGMTGPEFSSLGIDPQAVLNKFIYKMPVKFEVSSNPVIMDIAIFGVDEQSGKTISISKERIKKA